MNKNKYNNILVNKQYGKWNAVLAQNDLENYVFYQNHSKIFPEELQDWIASIKEVKLQNKFAPIRLDIDITNNCANNCVMCFAKELREKIIAAISMENLINIFNDFKKLGGKSVRLTGGGDPLNHPNIKDIIEHLAALELKITIETNGDLLTKNVMETIAQCVNHLRISVDAFDNVSRNNVHRPHNRKFTYDKLIENIKYITNKANELNRNEELFIGATFIALPENYLGISKFVSDMHNLGVRWVALRKNIYREIYEKNPQIIPFVEKEIETLKKLYAKYQDFTIEEQYGVSFAPQNDFNKCMVSRVRPIILANMSLQLCCLARNGLIPLADIGILPPTTSPLSDLLDNNSSVQKFHRSVPATCQFCIDKDNNISFGNIVSLLEKDENFAFSKAFVSVGSDKKMFVDENQIMQISLTKEEYEKFKCGTTVRI